MLRLYNLKVKNGWSDKIFMALLKFLKDMLPEVNELPDHTYDAKKIMFFMGMGYERIHAYSNDCTLYRKDYEGLESCPIYDADRCKKIRIKFS